MKSRTTDPTSADAAFEVLSRLGASTRLLVHSKLVSDVAVQISGALDHLGVHYDKTFVTIGSVLHDAGKIAHPEELNAPGNLHEAAGEQLLLQHGISPRLARVCRTHGQWDTFDVTLDERIIALADHLWMGKRGEVLERLVIRDVSHQLQTDDWSSFMKLDPAFEAIASGAEARLSAAVG